MSTQEISEAPLLGLFGSKTAYLVLMYLENYDSGYASGIAKTFNVTLNQVQKQLVKFEELGLLVSRKEGTTRMYYFKRSPVTDSLRVFLRDIRECLPKSTIQRFYRERQRPRRYGKR